MRDVVPAGVDVCWPGGAPVVGVRSGVGGNAARPLRGVSTVGRRGDMSIAMMDWSHQACATGGSSASDSSSDSAAAAALSRITFCSSSSSSSAAMVRDVRDRLRTRSLVGLRSSTARESCRGGDTTRWIKNFRRRSVSNMSSSPPSDESVRGGLTLFAASTETTGAVSFFSLRPKKFLSLRDWVGDGHATESSGLEM